LNDAGFLFSHEAQHLEISALFFDESWWRLSVGSKAPGLIGAGTGLGLVPAPGGFGSGLGYAVKNPSVTDLTVSHQTG
jgi:O-methyltransferase